MRRSLVLLICLDIAFSDPCPAGYTQGGNGGDCFKSIRFYDDFIGQYTPTSFDQAESFCNMYGGGLLASIRNEEENEVIWSMPWAKGPANIGLKCAGMACKWDDGAPVTYINFKDGGGPKDDGASRCFTMDSSPPSATWIERGCGKQKEDGWICRVKSRTIECSEGESEYKGGCVSVHSSPLDQQSAEAACPGGGHLVSIHSGTENEIYKNIALNAGMNGTIYIGGQYTNGVFEWTDRSYQGMSYWANSFPNTIFGKCVQMLLATEFGVQGQWTNIDCTTKQPYMCFRDGYDPEAPPTPRADPHCPATQYLNGSGIPGVMFPLYDCESGTTLSLFVGLNSTELFITLTSTPPDAFTAYSPAHNVMRMVFSTTESSAPVGKGWKAEVHVMCCG